MRLDRLTNSTREALMAAQQAALAAGHPELTPEHMLSALLSNKSAVAAPILQKAGVDARALGAQLETALGKLPKVKAAPSRACRGA